MNIPIILSTGSLYNFDVGSAMALASELGFGGLELVVDWRWETYQPAHLEKLMTRHNLPILAIHSPFSNGPIQGWPDEPVAIIKQTVTLAEALGAQIVVVHPPGRWVRFQGAIASPHYIRKISVPLPLAGPGQLGRWLWQDLAEFQTEISIKIAIENMPSRRLGPINLEPFHFSKLEQLSHFQYLALDTSHVGTRHANLLTFYQQLKEKVIHVHLSNFNGQEHQLLDNGQLPLASFLAELVRNKFDGLIALELNPFSLQAEDECALRQNLQASLDFCRKAPSLEATRL